MMVDRGSELLGLIHKHLLRNGYCKAARELQIESGEKFVSQKGSLKEIFRHWKTESQKRKGSKQSDAPSKKARLQDPVSSSESSDEEHNAHPKRADVVVQGKKGSVKKADKLKTEKKESSTPKKTKSAKKMTSKGKSTTKTGAASLNLKPVAPETPATLAKSSEDSDSEDEPVPSKATPVLGSPLKSRTSLTTDSQAARHDRSMPAKTTTTKPLSSSNGKAMAKDDSSDSSESSDETDIEKPPVTVTPNITTPSVSKLKTKTPSTGTQPKADSSESSDSESEEEPGSQMPTPVTFQAKAMTPSVKNSAAQVKATKKNAITKPPPVALASQSGSAVGKPPAKPMVNASSEDSDSDEEMPTPVTFQPKAMTPSAKNSAAQVKATKKNAITKPPPVTPASQSGSAVGKPPAKPMVDESSEDSDSDEELVPSTPLPTAPSIVQASKQKLQMQPTVPKPSSDDSSTSSETESEEEPVRQKQKTTASPKKGVTPATQAKVSSSQASKPSTIVPAAAEGSESSDSSDSESETPKKAANNLPGLNVRTPVPSTKLPVLTSPSAKARTPLPAPAVDTSETEDSDSEEEPAVKKTANQLQSSNVKTPSLSASTGKARTQLQSAAHATDSSETEDSDGDEEPQTKKTSLLSASSLTTPSTSAKRPVTPSHTAKAVAGTSGNLQKKAIADDSSETEDSDSEEDEGAKKTGSHLPASSVKTPSTGGKQPPTLAAHTTGVRLPADDSSEDSDSDESLAKAPIPAIATPKQKPIASQASAAAMRTPAKAAADESSEDSDSDEEPSSSVKAPVPTIITPSVRPSQAIAARAPDSDADSESSSSEEKTPAVGTTKPSKPAFAAKGKPGISQPDKESSSEDSDSDTDHRVPSAIHTPKTKVASHSKTAATPSAAPLSATKEKTPASRKAIVAQKPADTSETIDSSDYENPLPAQTLKGSFLPQKETVKRSLQPGAAVKSKKGSPVKAVKDTVKESSNKEEQGTLKTDLPALAKHKMSTAIPLLTSSPAKGKAGLPTKSQKSVMTAHALVHESSDSESDAKVAEQVGTPAPSSAKAAVEKGSRSVAKTPKASKGKTVKSASRGKTSVVPTANVSRNSSESNSSDEKAIKLTPTVQTKLEKFFVKRSITPAKTKAKSTASLSKAILTDSETSDEEPVKEATPAPDTPKSHGKERPDSSSFATPKTKGKMACLISSPKATNADSKASGDVPSKPTVSGEEDDSADSSEPEESQSLLQAKTPSKPSSKKRKRDKEKTAVATESITQSSKKKHKVKTQPPLSAPATPGALLDSEEETVMALLEGRSPKKSKKNTSKKTVASSTPTVQNSNVFEKSLPSVPSALVPESPRSVHKKNKTLDAKSPAVPELGHLSAKKEKPGKKRKSSPEYGLSKQKDKDAKKAKKEKKHKKVKDTSISGEAASPKPSKKEKKKSEKSKKKKDDKKQKKKESKKLSQSLIAPVGESTDSGVSLQSKPKKKKKVKGD